MVLAASSIGGWCGRLEAALAEWRFVTSIDVLVGLGWLEPRRVDEWRQGRIPYLEAVVIARGIYQPGVRVAAQSEAIPLPPTTNRRPRQRQERDVRRLPLPGCARPERQRRPRDRVGDIAAVKPG